MAKATDSDERTEITFFSWEAARPWLIGLLAAVPVMLLIGWLGPRWLSERAVSELALTLSLPLILVVRARVAGLSRASAAQTLGAYVALVALFLGAQWLLRVITGRA